MRKRDSNPGFTNGQAFHLASPTSAERCDSSLHPNGILSGLN